MDGVPVSTASGGGGLKVSMGVPEGTAKIWPAKFVPYPTDILGDF